MKGKILMVMNNCGEYRPVRFYPEFHYKQADVDLKLLTENTIEVWELIEVEIFGETYN